MFDGTTVVLFNDFIDGLSFLSICFDITGFLTSLVFLGLLSNLDNKAKKLCLPPAAVGGLSFSSFFGCNFFISIFLGSSFFGSHLLVSSFLDSSFFVSGFLGSGFLDSSFF